MLAALLLASVANGALAWAPALTPGPAASAADPSIVDELSRLAGHQVNVAADGKRYVIEDVAGEGKPIVGVVERRGKHLWLVAEGGAEYRLTGVLAKPRIAGPGYKVWVLGEVNRAGDLRAKRLGVLAGPGRGSSRR